MEQSVNTEPLNLPGVMPGQPLIIAGPCSAETEEQTIETAKQLSAAGIQIFRAGIWKPRTRPGAFEGVGSVGFKWLRRVKEETGMLVAVEVATANHVYEALKFGIDIVWIGARTSANPFAVQEIATALSGVNIPVLVKNPVNPDLDLWIGAFERLLGAGLSRLAAVHRGFSSVGTSAYRNQPLWEIPLAFKKQFPEIMMLNDPSHISGRRELIPHVARKAVELGFDGFIIESHFDPENALSDKEQQLSPTALTELLGNLFNGRINDVNQDDIGYLVDLRNQIDFCDHELMFALLDRMNVSKKIGSFKSDKNMEVIQNGRWNELLNARLSEGKDMGLREEFVEELFNYIHRESVSLQVKNGK